ncbi:unnamed protein product [Phytomonas sp. EM1]|nr:unnamed protein product [Phytomonas sp. EM1]|eukprot:CCW62759.1 unnamed protein product [Phytomonas sp. isolate EM1]
MKNGNKLAKDETDLPFVAATFPRLKDIDDTSVNYDNEMPSNMINSRSNIPGITPQELLAAHRRSLAELSEHSNELDFHSLTLSRHQIDGGEVFSAQLDDIPDEEYQECLRSFKFGDENSGLGGGSSDPASTKSDEEQ